MRLRSALGVGVVIASCAVRAPALPTTACPTGTAPDAARTASLAALLHGHSAAAALEASIGRRGELAPTVCFGAAESALLPDGTLLLSEERDERLAAARLAHLLVHATTGSPFDDDVGAECEPRLALAREREADALAVEATLLARLGVEAKLIERRTGEGALAARIAAYAHRCRSAHPVTVAAPRAAREHGHPRGW